VVYYVPHPVLMTRDRSLLQSVGEIQAPNLCNGKIVAMRLQESHYLGAEIVFIDRQTAYVG
jgi:hypothetical protein